MMHMHEKCLSWPIDVHSLILKSLSKMADLREITGFFIENNGTVVLYEFKEHSQILKSRSKMADQRELREIPILNIKRLFRSQISELNNLT